MVYAVIDTNIFVSALITHNSNASTARVLESLTLDNELQEIITAGIASSHGRRHLLPR